MATLFGLYWCQTSFGLKYRENFTVSLNGILYLIPSKTDIIHETTVVSALNIESTSDNPTCNEYKQGKMEVFAWHDCSHKMNWVWFVVEKCLFVFNMFTPVGELINKHVFIGTGLFVYVVLICVLSCVFKMLVFVFFIFKI